MAVEVAVAVVGRHLHQVVQLLLPEREALHVHDLDARPAVDPLRVRGGVLAGERLRERREVVALGADVRRERHHRLLIHFPNQVLDEALDALDWRHPLDRPVLGDADARDVGRTHYAERDFATQESMACGVHASGAPHADQVVNLVACSGVDPFLRVLGLGHLAGRGDEFLGVDLNRRAVGVQGVVGLVALLSRVRIRNLIREFGDVGPGGVEQAGCGPP